MKSKRIKHSDRGFGTHPNEGHDGKAPATTRKLRRGDVAKMTHADHVARANRPKIGNPPQSHTKVNRDGFAKNSKG